MKKDCDDLLARDQYKTQRGSSQAKVNTLLEELLQKEAETALYKNRLKELETAFYYNLDLIAERDLELSVLEKQLSSENKQLQEVICERDELEDLVKIIDEKNNRKTQQLEMKLSIKEKEVINLQRENITNVNTLKKLIDDLKQQQQKKLNKMASKFEIHKDEIIKNYKEEVEKNEKFYLIEINNLNGKLEQVCRERDKAEQERKNLKHHFQDAERLFLEKENQYLQQVKKLTSSRTRKNSIEIQCNFKPQGVDEITQAQPHTVTGFAQTDIDSNEEYIQRINLLEEQNEVLKYIIKDLKKNRKSEDHGQPPGCECLALKTELEHVNKKFENEINNLRKILEEEQKLKTEEDAMIQSLETSVCCLKDKLLSGLQEKLGDYTGLADGDDICVYTYNREIQNEIQIKLLEETLTKKIETLILNSEKERGKLVEKLEEVKKECLNQIDKHFKPELNSENLLQKIRLEIQKLENKIETDMKNIVKNNSQKDKCDKNYQTNTSQILNHSIPMVVPSTIHNNQKIDTSGLYYNNDLSHEKCISVFKHSRDGYFQNQSAKTVDNKRTSWNSTNRFMKNR